MSLDKMMEKHKDMYQTIYIELDNGTWGEFHGAVLFDDNKQLVIKQLKVSKPKKIPDNLTWKDLYEMQQTKPTATSS